ncbi:MULTISPECIES: hypothetical protein [unclassified Modestobacter]
MSPEPPDDATYVEPGGSWRPFWLAAAGLAVVIALAAVLPGPDLPAGAWAALAVLVLGVVAAGCLSARRAWTVRVGGRGSDAALSVGRERVPLADVDADHLRAVRAGTAGVDAGAPVLGGGWSLPRGRTGLPLRRNDGGTVLVPTRAPQAVTAAILAGHPGGGAPTDRPGRVEP